MLFRVCVFTGTLATLYLSVFAHAEPRKVRISGYVPISCEVSMQSNFREVSTGTYKIGSLSRFCNTRYQMVFTYSGSAQGAQFRVNGSVAPVQTNSTIVEANSRPTNASHIVYITNTSFTQAQTIASTLSVIVTPAGL